MISNFPDVILCDLSRESVESRNFKDIEKVLSVLKSRGSEARQILEITFNGYDDTPDEIYEIDAIRKYVTQLLFKYTSILYYIGNRMESMQNLVLCSCDFETMFIGEKKPISAYSLEDIAQQNLPMQKVTVNIPKVKMDSWKKAILKEGKRNNDLTGAELVIQTMESALNVKF